MNTSCPIDSALYDFTPQKLERGILVVVVLIDIITNLEREIYLFTDFKR